MSGAVTADPDGPGGERWLRAQVPRLLRSAAASRVPGGFGWLSWSDGGDLAVAPARGTPLWITARMTHVFAVGALLGRDGADGTDDLARHGVDALAGPFEDAEHGGWYDPPGSVAGSPSEPGAKGAYEHAFVVLASSTATAAGVDGARELLDRALAVVDERFWEPAHSLAADSWDRGWTACEPYRGANANMHLVEALLAAADATGDARWTDRALGVAEQLIDRRARHRGWRVPEHFDADWHELPEYNADRVRDPFRPYGATPGHGVEWARLLGQLSLRHPDRAWLLPAAGALVDRAVADGWDAVGLRYTTDASGATVVGDHFHWGVCELASAAAVLGELTGEERYAGLARQAWDVAAAHYVDEPSGTWRHELDADGRPAARTWPGRPDAYHALGALLAPLLPPATSVPAAIAAAPGPVLG